MKRYISGIPAKTRYWRNRLDDIPSLFLRPQDNVKFLCNICGKRQIVPKMRLSRESVSCRCGSTVRFRSLIKVLSAAIYGEPHPIPDMPVRPDIVGIDMSGAEIYAARLRERLGYINTFFHRSPRFDILSPPKEWFGRYDFILSSDVFEHVSPPVSHAFANSYRLLKPNGVLILTVPYRPDGETLEHYPDLFHYQIEGNGAHRIVINTTREGKLQKFTNPVFHGGDGATLEMRIFSLPNLIELLSSAGFIDIRVHSDDDPRFGIIWEHPWSLPISARRPHD